MILCEMNSTFDHIRDKILIGQEIPTMESFTKRFLHFPALQGRNLQESTECSAMVYACAKGILELKEEVVVEDVLNVHIV